MSHHLHPTLRKPRRSGAPFPVLLGCCYLCFWVCQLPITNYQLLLSTNVYRGCRRSRRAVDSNVAPSHQGCLCDADGEVCFFEEFTRFRFPRFILLQLLGVEVAFPISPLVPQFLCAEDLVLVLAQPTLRPSAFYLRQNGFCSWFLRDLPKVPACRGLPMACGLPSMAYGLKCLHG